MAKTKKFHKKAGMTIPLAVVAGFAPLAVNVMNTPGGLEPKGWMLTQALTGYDTRVGKWWAPNLAKGALPIIAGLVVHKIAGRLGINKVLSAAKIPLIRL